MLLLVGLSASLPPAFRTDHSAPPQYQFEYRAEDEYAGLRFGQQEQRDGAETSGQYSVLLPDGRRQTVTYTVVGERGFQADVSYDGEPSAYSVEAAAHNQPAPVYGPRLASRPSRVRHPARPVYGQRVRTYTLQSAVAGEKPTEEAAEEEVAVEEAEDVEEEAEDAEEEAAEEAELKVTAEEKTYEEDAE